jgi:TolB protein
MAMTIRVLAVLVLMMSAMTPVRAQLRIDITEGVDKALPIAVVPFGWQGGGDAAPIDVGAVIAADLSRTGRFAAIDPELMLQKPTAGSEVDFSDWRILGVEIVVVGQLIEGTEGEYTIQFQVFDVFRGEQLLGYRQPSSRGELRPASHRVADLIYEELTGVKGIFTTHIAYISVAGELEAQTYHLIVADWDGENAKILMESGEPIMSPAWSPDGRKLAYVSFENGNSEIFIQSLRSGARQRASARTGVNGAPSWSPDGRMLALTLSGTDGNLDIYTLDIASQVLKRLTTRGSIDTEPEWSRDGAFIYFTSGRGGGPQIYRIPAAGGGRATRVTFEGNYNARARISPEADQMAVVHNDRGNYRIAVIDVEKGFTQILTEGHLDESPSFAPNGQTLIYATRQGNRDVLAMVSIDGSIRQRISSVAGNVREPVWSPFPSN